jgi:hypothetical protein
MHNKITLKYQISNIKYTLHTLKIIMGFTFILCNNKKRTSATSNLLFRPFHHWVLKLPSLLFVWVNLCLLVRQNSYFFLGVYLPLFHAALFTKLSIHWTSKFIILLVIQSASKLAWKIQIWNHILENLLFDNLFNVN